MMTFMTSYPAPGSQPRPLQSVAEIMGDPFMHKHEVVSVEITQALLDVSRLLLTVPKLDYLLEQILQILGTLVSYDTAAIHLATGERLYTQAAVGRAVHTVGQSNFQLSSDFVWQTIEKTRDLYMCRDVQQASWKPLAGFEYVRSFIAIPLAVQNQLIGILTIDHPEPDYFDGEDATVLRLFANHSAIAIQHARLLAESQRHIQDLEILQTTGLISIVETDARTIARETLKILQEAFGYDLVSMYRVGENALHLLAQYNYPSATVRYVIPLSTGVMATCVRQRSPILIKDVAQHPEFIAAAPNIHSELCVPIFVQEKVYGVINIESQQPGKLGDNDLRLLTILAGKLGVTFQNLQLYDEINQRLTALSTLHASSLDIASGMEEDELLNSFIERLLSLTQAQTAAIFLYDTFNDALMTSGILPPTPLLSLGTPQPKDKGILGQVFTQSTPVYVADYALYPAKDRTWPQDRFEIGAAGVLPLLIKGEIIGVLAVLQARNHEFSPEEKQIHSIFANQIATAIENRRLFQAEQRQRKFAETQLDFSFRLMETNTLTGAVEALFDTIGQFVDYDTGSVMLLDPDNSEVGYFAVVSGYTNPDEARHRRLRMSDYPLLGQIRQERREIYFADVRGDMRWRPGHQPDPHEVRSILMAPLLYNHQAEMIGCLTLKSYRANAFAAEIRSNITLLCNQTAGAVRNIRLLEETRRRLNEVSVLAEISEMLNRTFDLETMLRSVLDQVITILAESEAKWQLQGAIILRQQPGDILRLAIGYNISEEYRTHFNQRPFYAHEGSFERSILQGEWVEIVGAENIKGQIGWEHSDIYLNELLNIPLKVGAEVIGVITANRVVSDPTTRRLLGAISELAGSAIQKTRLLGQARRRAVDLMEAYEALNQMDHMREEFIQNITHDLRAPLTFIRGYSDLMIEGAMGDITDEQREALEVIQERTDVINRLVGDILKVREYESQPLREETLNLLEVARTVVRSALMTARKAGLDITLTNLAQKVMVHGDADRLGQVFDNLLSNAIKYTKPGGHVRVAVENRGQRVVVSVADTGIGIPAEEVDHVWDRYYRVRSTSSEYSGTGLGLGNARRIIEAHGGHIWVQSSKEGTTFTFELPLTNDALLPPTDVDTPGLLTP